MNKLFLCLLLLTVVGCMQRREEVDEKTLLKNEIQSIDWTTVDEYPSFEYCDTVENKGLPEGQCFFDTLREHIENILLDSKLAFGSSETNRILIRTHIAPNQKPILTVETCEDESMREEINRVLLEGVDNIPYIYPAMKRNVPVAVEFVLTVNINRE